MRFAVIGAGGVGGFFGAMLSSAGEDVMFMARGPHLEAMKREGLRVISPRGLVEVPPERCVGSPAEIGPVDTVLFCVKSYDTERTAPALAPLLGPATVVISLQNGIDNEEKLERALPGRTIFGGVAYIYSTITRPGEVTVAAGPVKIVFGPFAGAPPEHHRRAAELRDICAHAGITAESSGDIIAALWEKFIFITGAGGITALTRLTLGEILAVDQSRDLLADAMRETESIARARGVRVEEHFLDRVFGTLARFDNKTRSSLYYDLVHGKPLEIEALAGTVVRYGTALGIPTPVNRAVYAALLPYHIHNSESIR
jgi:2-dehydropantoate 2-reductase